VKYTRIQRRTTENFITIGEFLQESQPNILQKLYRGFRLKDVTELILAAADVSGVDKRYQYVMQERPNPGRGGLLPGEGDEALHD
jgi:hypothetical protein